MTVTDWQVVAVTIAAIGATGFAVLYGITAPWYRSQIGRALLLSDASLAVLLDLAVAAHFWHFTVSKQVGLLIEVFIAFAAVLRLWAVIRQQILRR